MTAKITTHQVYRVSIAVAPDFYKLAFDRKFLGLPNETQVKAYIRQLMRGNKHTDELSQHIREGRGACLKLLDSYGLPSVASFPRGAVTKPDGRIEIKRLENVIQVEEH